ncbi:hemerythrin HHE cation binding domain protein [Secundilactobacillus pentosiphilus]|uniref:Hemerythrin HHE cation binding domain protein n=1 Tax=Secundilactobacillus pentosiphilus TaxID=1714682 RepID=A0A1Z5IP83_9LACO|nr:PAS domain-containing protein [Secundilactobacillus pentosiphilus]GAX03506.1 hemerythrin HHE cation binding domain protein [Secundilactobacillus pentosiphilus]
MNDEKVTLDENNVLHFRTGEIPMEALRVLLNTLPFEVDYVDATDHFKWFSDDGNRIFQRTPDQVGREVLKCHPAKASDKVAQILKEFHAGTRNQFEFWLPLNGHLIYISYYALRDEEGKYLGCFEFTGNIDHLQSLKGTKILENSRDITVQHDSQQ